MTNNALVPCSNMLGKDYGHRNVTRTMRDVKQLNESTFLLISSINLILKSAAPPLLVLFYSPVKSTEVYIPIRML